MDVVVLQMAAVPGDVAGNVAAVVALAATHGHGADLVVTPELVTSGYDLDLLGTDGLDLAHSLDGPAVAAVAAVAAETGRRSCSGCSSATATRSTTAP